MQTAMPMNFADKTIFTRDNIDVLRGFNSECVDLIYLDPPFNSNKNYSAPIGSKAAGAAFKDTWTLSDLDTAWMGLIADEHPSLYATLAAAGLSHGKRMQSYLCMMAVRLLEMKRILKPTGSIYLHCDQTASHYLKVIMDVVFGKANFKNEVVWKRVNARGDGNRYGRVSDSILFYTRSNQYTWNNVYVRDEEYVRKTFRNVDSRGAYRLTVLTGPGGASGGSDEEWRGYVPGVIGRHWSVPLTGKYADWIEENVIPGYKSLPSFKARLDALFDADMIEFSKNGTPNFKQYADSYTGTKVNNLFTDIPQVRGKERVGYPTQKPLKLMERIIKASSNPGDVVLDPFCGCATTCIAAETLGRKWAGIDISPRAAELVTYRLKLTMGDLFHHTMVTIRTDIPQRTDIGKPIHYRKNKHVLFGRQEGKCNGCGMDYPFRILEVDHVIPKARGGTDHIDNLQLLCSLCNRIKGDRPQEYLFMRLREEGLMSES